MVSVIIPVHNDKKLIGRAVSSVLDQSYKDVEIIIVDNGSEDTSLYEGAIYSDRRIRVVIKSKALGAAGARNLGLQYAKGEYVAFLDADDYWAADKLSKQLKVMEKFKINGEAPLICFTGRSIVADEESVSTKGISGKYIGCDKVVRYGKLLKSNQINCSSVLLRKDILPENPFPVAEKDIHEDYVLWLTLLKDGGYAAGINRPLLYYQLSYDSKSGNKLKSAIMNYRVYKYMGIRWLERIKYMMYYTYYGFKKYSK